MLASSSAGYTVQKIFLNQQGRVVSLNFLFFIQTCPNCKGLEEVYEGLS